MLAFVPAQRHGSIMSRYFPSYHVATLSNNNPNVKVRTHTCLLQRQQGTMGFSFWLSLCHRLLPSMTSNGKNWVKGRGIPQRHALLGNKDVI